MPSGFSFKTYYAVRFQNAYVLSFEQGQRGWTDTPKSWLESHLAAARADSSIEHVFVVIHHPLYSTWMLESSPNGPALSPVRGEYEALLRDYDVTLVFNGHAHLYEHFYVPDDDSPTRLDAPRPSYPHDGTAIHHVTTGGAGGPLPGSCNPIPPPRLERSYDYLQSRNCGYHFTRVEVDGKRLHLSVVHVVGSESSFTAELWDEFTIE